MNETCRIHFGCKGFVKIKFSGDSNPLHLGSVETLLERCVSSQKLLALDKLLEKYRSTELPKMAQNMGRNGKGERRKRRENSKWLYQKAIMLAEIKFQQQ